MKSRYEVDKLKKYIKQIRGVSYTKKEVSSTYKEGYVPVLRANNIKDDKLNFNDIVFVKEKNIKLEQYIKKGDILIAASSGSKHIVGKAAQARENVNASFGAFCKLIRVNANINKRYLGYYFKSPYYRHIISSLAMGANINNIKNEHIDNLLIPLPPIEIQKKIVDVLDKAQELIDKRKEQIEKLDEFIQSVFLDMFGDPICNTNKWKKQKLTDIVKKQKHSIKAGPFGSTLKKEFYTNRGYKIYGQEQVIRDDFNYGDYYIDEDRYSKLINYKVEINDILISLVGTYGKVAIVPPNHHPGIINPRLVKISLNQEKMISLFFKFLFTSESFREYLNNISRGGTMNILNVKMLKELELIVPPIELQNKFAEIVEKTEKQKELLQKSLNEMENNFNSLMQKAFRGELF